MMILQLTSVEQVVPIWAKLKNTGNSQLLGRSWSMMGRSLIGKFFVIRKSSWIQWVSFFSKEGTRLII